MKAIVELTSALANINIDARTRMVALYANPMAAVAANVAQQLPQLAHRATAPAFEARLVAAISLFRAGSSTVDFRNLRLACHGCCHFIETDHYALVADLKGIQSLIAEVASYAHEQRRFRRLYDGLMRAYLGVDREVDWFRTDAAREGNEALRRFLEGGFPTISELEPKPDWVSAVRSFPEVLSRNPGQRFAEGWLAGNTAEFEDASRRLSLKGTSWLVKDVLQAALSTTYALNDEQFIARIPSFLSAADEPRFKSLRDDIYAGLLTRYSTVTTPPVHPGLRDALVAAWKNPWLPRNESAWARVPENARQMVASWLKLELIHQFFEVLSEDGRQDRRRFEFWRRYHEHMDDVYFALGSRSYHSQSPDIKKLRAALDGRLFELTNTGADNNAFIMCMGKTIVVEFSKTGNAAYRYDRQQLQLDVARKSIGIGELKHDRTRRMLHKFAHGREWEQLFSSFLGEAGHFDARINSGRRASQPPPLPPPTTAKFAKLFAPDISAFAQDRGITLNDHRSKGGSLWVLTDLSDPAVSRQLEVWGFTYRAGKGWWSSTE